jgi:hypothetical protein
MRIGCFQSCACLSSCYEFAKKSLTATVIKLDEIRKDPEAFQKACIVVRSIIQGINFYYRTNYLPELVKILHVTESFDFYGFCRMQHSLLHPYLPDRLEEYVILDQLEVILCHNWHLGIPDDKRQNRDPLVRQFAKDQLNAFLEQMVENEQDLRTEEEVKTLLYQWLVQTLEANPIKTFDPYGIDLKDLKIPLKKTTWLDVLTDCTFVVIDIACVPAFLREWSLINLSHYANRLGRLPFLSWMPNQDLDEWIWGTMGAGYLLQFCQGCHRLWQGELTRKEANDAKWQIVAALAECLYCFAILQKRDPRLITLLAFTAKSLGLLRFLFAPKPSFFNRYET